MSPWAWSCTIPRLGNGRTLDGTPSSSVSLSMFCSKPAARSLWSFARAVRNPAPSDSGQPLYEIEFKGVKIDRCPGCQGVWLDAGELELVSQKEGLLGGLTKLFK